MQEDTSGPVVVKSRRSAIGLDKKKYLDSMDRSHHLHEMYLINRSQFLPNDSIVAILGYC